MTGFGKTQISLCREVRWSCFWLPLCEEPAKTRRELVHHLRNQIPQPLGVHRHRVWSLSLRHVLLLAASGMLWHTANWICLQIIHVWSPVIWIWFPVFWLWLQTFWIWPKITRWQGKKEEAALVWLVWMIDFKSKLWVYQFYWNYFFCWIWWCWYRVLISIPQFADLRTCILKVCRFFPFQAIQL